MSRIETPNGNLGTWAENEDPGAGSQTVESGNTGLNFNWLRISKLFIEHGTDGAHASNIIDKAQLKTTVADGTSIEKDGSVGLRVKALGIASTMLAAGAVVAGKIADGAVDATGRIVDRIVTGAKIALATILTENLADDAVTAVKISHDNNRTKTFFVFSFDAGLETGYFTSSRWAYAAFGRLGRGFAVTGLAVCDQTGASIVYSTPYSSSGSNHYSSSDKVQLYSSDGSDIEIRKNGATGWISVDTSALASNKWEAILELELDD